VSSEQIWLAAGGALALLLLVGVLALARVVRRLGARVATLEAALGSALETRADETAPQPAAAVEPASYVITGIDRVEDDEPTVAVQGRIDGALFADIVARESAIRAAGIAHGLRRALAPEARNRIRFEMKREVKRSRKQRRADLKEALRDMQARERAQMADRRDEGDAA
jgi:hypothetical protein